MLPGVRNSSFFFSHLRPARTRPCLKRAISTLAGHWHGVVVRLSDRSTSVIPARGCRARNPGSFGCCLSVLAQIEPVRVHRFDEPDFCTSRHALDLGLAVDRLVNVAEMFEIDQLVYLIPV